MDNNQHFYVSLFCFDGVFYTTSYAEITIPPSNYNGNTLATILQTQVNLQLESDMKHIIVGTYSFTENLLKMEMIDECAKKAGMVATVNLISVYDLS